MKQYINVEQLNELTEKQRRRLGKWALTKEEIKWYDRGAEYPLLTIGQMMEFLIERKNFTFLGTLEQNDPKEWCNILWEEVKKEFDLEIKTTGEKVEIFLDKKLIGRGTFSIR